jgi:Reverse transcriptase (RNA-dependent DNA polymerase)
MDCIPDVLLTYDSPLVVSLITRFINECFQAGHIPAPFRTARLHLINKVPFCTPTLDDLRPIMISSPLIKVMEAIALRELKQKIEPLICRAQVGFQSKMSTSVHLMRLIGRLKDIKSTVENYSGKFFTIFVDFKSAFDKVDHTLLMERLKRDAGISESCLNIVRLLYNSYHFSVAGSAPLKVNSGVAQGSLISPILFAWYIDPLVRDLCSKFGEQNVFAYADDIAVIAKGRVQIRQCFEIIEAWAERNKAALNKKKCGIMPLVGRDTVATGKHTALLHGVPVVSSYKYLGVPLDPALTLKNAVPVLRKRMQTFKRYVGSLKAGIIGTKLRLEAWKVYFKSIFDYFSPVFMLCDRVHEIATIYTTTLKKACSLPMSCNNDRLLAALRLPSPTALGSYFMGLAFEKVLERGVTCPDSLKASYFGAVMSIDKYKQLKQERHWLKMKGVYEADGFAIVDCLSLPDNGVNHTTLYFVVGDLLTRRHPYGAVMLCPRCQVPALQRHLLNECPTLQDFRHAIAAVFTQELTQEPTSLQDYDSLVRSLPELKLERTQESTDNTGSDALLLRVESLRKFSNSLDSLVESVVTSVNNLFERVSLASDSS